MSIAEYKQLFPHHPSGWDTFKDFNSASPSSPSELKPTNNEMRASSQVALHQLSELATPDPKHLPKRKHSEIEDAGTSRCAAARFGKQQKPETFSVDGREITIKYVRDKQTGKQVLNMSKVTIRFLNGDIYTGPADETGKDEAINGNGKLEGEKFDYEGSTSTHFIYEGPFLKGKKDGEGRFIYTNAQNQWITFNGNWKDDHLHGRASTNWLSYYNLEHWGMYQNGLRHGDGKLSYTPENGRSTCICQGEWKEGKFIGLGDNVAQNVQELIAKATAGDVEKSDFLRDIEDLKKAVKTAKITAKRAIKLDVA
jgi:hypothetical protein